MSVTWKLHREDMAPRPPRMTECCQPVCPMVCEVEVEPVLGAWETRYRGRCGETRRGKADSVEEAKQAALDAAEDMLCEALGGLRLARGGFRIPPDVVFCDVPMAEVAK